jgi:hypothetical protein
MKSASPATAINFRIARLTLENYSRSEQIRFTRTLEKRLRDFVSRAPGMSWSAVKGADKINAGMLSPDATPEQAARQVAGYIAMKLRPTQQETTRALPERSEEDRYA